MRIFTVLTLLTVGVRGTVEKLVNIFCPSRDFPEYTEFNSKVSEYFLKNFGRGGIEYLKIVAPKSKLGRVGCFNNLIETKCLDDDSAKIFAEMNRIIAGYNPSLLDPSSWSLKRKGIGSARYSLHRFVGLIESISSSHELSTLTSRVRCLDPSFKVNFLEAFPKGRRRQLSEGLEIFKRLISDCSLSDEMVKNALIVIGRLKGTRLIDSVYQNNEEICSSLEILLTDTTEKKHTVENSLASADQDSKNK